MLATKDRISTRHSQKPCPTSKLRSSGAPIKSKASPFCPNAGSSSARLRGSTAAEGSPKIGKTSIARRSHSCALLQSASCSENSAIPANVSGQTLTGRVRLIVSSLPHRQNNSNNRGDNDNNCCGCKILLNVEARGNQRESYKR